MRDVSVSGLFLAYIQNTVSLFKHVFDLPLIIQRLHLDILKQVIF